MMKKIFVLIQLILFSSMINAQNWTRNLPQDKMTSGDLSFYEIQKAFNDYWAPFNVGKNGYYVKNGDSIKAPGWKQFRRWEYYWEDRVDKETGRFPSTTAWEELQKKGVQNTGSRSLLGMWNPIGPTTTPGGSEGLGRLNCVAFVPGNNNIIYVGSASGGIWRSSNGGTSWTPIGDNNPVLGVSDIAIVPGTDPQVIYIATGDKDGGSMWSLGGGHYSDNHSVGVRRSGNGGATWGSAGLTFLPGQRELIYRLLLHPSNSNILYAATSLGLYKTTDGADTWTQLTPRAFCDLEFKPGTPSTLYGSTYSGSIFRSTDNGVTWSQTLSTSHGRTELAVSADNSGVVYAVLANAGSNASICQNKTHSLFGTVTQAAGYYWITSGDGTFSNPNILTPVYTPGSQDIDQGSAILSLVAQPLEPCTLNDTASMLLTIQKTPAVSAGTLQTVCDNQVVQLQGTADNYSSLIWLNNLGDGTISNRTILNPVYTLGANDITRGFVILTLYAQPVSPCFAPISSNVRINITKQPVAVAGNNAQICENLSYSLSGTVQNAGSYAWTTSGDGSFSSTSVTNPFYTPGPGDIIAESVVLTLTAQPRTPCQSPAVSSLTLSIQSSPEVYAGEDDLVCEGGGYLLNGSAQHYVSVLWQTLGDGSFSDPALLNPIYYPGVMDALNGTAELSLTAYPSSPCTNPAIDYVEIDIQWLPVVNAGNDIQICQAEGVALNGSVTGSSQYSWSSSGDGVFENPNSLNTAYIPGTEDMLSDSVVLTLTATSVIPCTQTVSDQLTLTILTCQELNLPSGWTGISTFVDPSNPDLNGIFAPVIDDLIILYSQTGIFWPGQNINTLGTWNYHEGYIIKMAESLTLTVPGNRAGSRTLSLNAGWNLIPVHSECDADVVELFGGTSPVMVKEVAGWNLWWPALNINTLVSLQPGRAYYVLMAEAGSITFPACDQGNLNPGSGSGNLKMAEMIQASPWNRIVKTPSTHMLGIPVSAFTPGFIQNGDYLGAFDAEGNSFGVVKWKGESAVLVAFGDDPTTSAKDGFEEGEAIYFRLYATADNTQSDLDVVFDHTLPHFSGHFSVNGVSAIQAFTLDAARIVSPENLPVMIYPNPADNELFIDFTEIMEAKAVMLDVNGKEVITAVLSARHNRLDISGLMKGIYFVKLESAGFSKVEKIVLK